MILSKIKICFGKIIDTNKVSIIYFWLKLWYNLDMNFSSRTINFISIILTSIIFLIIMFFLYKSPSREENNKQNDINFFEQNMIDRNVEWRYNKSNL